MSAPRRFDFLDHTADLQVRLVAESSTALFELGAEVLFQLLCDRPASDFAAVEVEISQMSLQAPDLPELFARWLEELVFLLDARGLAPLSVEVTLEEGVSLRASLSCATLEALRRAGSELQRVPKAVTRHKLRFEPASQGEWVAEVVFDV